MESATIWLTFGLLNGFGFAYNVMVHVLHRRGWSRGFSSVLVVFGVAGTLLAMSPIVGLFHTVLLFGAFAASGFWMVAGDIFRYVVERETELRQVQEVMSDASA